jgi:CRISPR system Cascade subunit CasE
MTHYLSRLNIAQNPSTDALKVLLDPENQDLAMDAHHRLIWSAFAGSAENKRDFLWRAEGNGAFIVLSERAPMPSPIFEPHQIKEFSPKLGPGDVLRFALRVNATKARPKKYAVKSNGKSGDRRVDIVMHSLKNIPQLERATERMKIAQSQGQAWLVSQGQKNGFEISQCIVSDYSVHALPNHRGQRKGQPQFGVLEMSGLLRVTDPALFLPKLVSGFGRAKAFGCGLMLVKRA